MALNTERGMLMTHKLFLSGVLLISLTETGIAQINMQQMPSYSGENHTASASARGQTGGMPSSELRAVPQDFAQLKLAPGFLVGLNVLDDSDFAGTFRIDEQGSIAVPVLGTVHVAGETASEAREQIKNLLVAEQIMKDPQVTLTVMEYTAPEVTIIGEVGSPGKYPLLVPRKLVDVLALAGGPSMLAGNEIQIIPGNEGAKPALVHYSRNADPKSIQDVMVRPGDTVQVKRAGIVYVLGAVNRPGGFVMQEEGTLNVLQALSLANGTSVAAKDSTIYLLRREADGTEVDIALPYKKISHGKRADVQLHATDVLFVPTSAVKSILTNSQAILSAAASASIYAAYSF